MILTEYDEEKVKEMFKQEYWDDGYSAGEQRGYDKGIKEEKYMMAVRMKSMGVPEEQLAKFLDVTPEKLKEMLSSDKLHEESKEYTAGK